MKESRSQKKVESKRAQRKEAKERAPGGEHRAICQRLWKARTEDEVTNGGGDASGGKAKGKSKPWLCGSLIQILKNGVENAGNVNWKGRVSPRC